MRADRVFGAMGSTANVTVIADDHPEELARWAETRVACLEARWSRFLPTSEVSRLNAAPRCRPVIVSADTFHLIETAVAAWRITRGAFDPSVLGSLVALGYDRSFEELPAAVGSSLDGTAGVPAAGLADVILDAPLRAVTLPEGVGFDPGGIGKGLAADLVAGELIERGARGALVELGGDLRVLGDGPADGAWIIEVGNHRDRGEPLVRLALHDAGVATSSTRKRRWAAPGGDRHHLVAPTTGRPLDGRFDTASAVAPTAWLAEAATKAALVLGRTDTIPSAHVDLRGPAESSTTQVLEELLG